MTTVTPDQLRNVFAQTLSPDASIRQQGMYLSLFKTKKEF